MYIPWKQMQRPKQSLKVRLTIFFWSFFKLFPLTPLQKGVNLGERPSPLFHLLLKVSFVWCVFVIEVSWPWRDLTQCRIAVENSKHKKNTDNAKIYLPPGQIINQHSISCLFLSDTRANFITAYSVYLLSDDPEMSQLIFVFLIFWILCFIYLSCLFIILYIYLIHLFVYFYSFIYYLPLSTSAVRFWVSWGWRVQIKESSVGGVWIFSGTTH